MDDKAKRRYSYLMAIAPVAATALQVLFGSAPVVMLAFGAVVGVIAFLLFRLLAGVRVFAPGKLRFGRNRALRAWQAPALWVPIVVTVGGVVFVWLVR